MFICSKNFSYILCKEYVKIIIDIELLRLLSYIRIIMVFYRLQKNLLGLIMTKAEFLELLKKYNINENLVVFDDAIKEGYCVRKNHFRWEVFFRERGKEYDCVGFPSESNALQYLFDKLYSIYVK